MRMNKLRNWLMSAGNSAALSNSL